MEFESYLENFDYNSRKEMKIETKEMLELVKANKAVVIDIRFEEEVKCWSLGFAKNIPLNQLPQKLNQLPKDKLIITACPHNERANIARMFLVTKGFKARHLSDGLLKTVDILKGDNAINFINK